VKCSIIYDRIRDASVDLVLIAFFAPSFGSSLRSAIEDRFNATDNPSTGNPPAVAGVYVLDHCAIIRPVCYATSAGSDGECR
jgi:hypothetical protein